MIEIVARSARARMRSAFEGLTGYGRRMFAIPAATNTSASPTLAQHTPTAPRSICHFAMVGDLCVFACGRSATPAFEASCCARSMLRRNRAWSIRTCGVGRSESSMWRITRKRSRPGKVEVLEARNALFCDRRELLELVGLDGGEVETRFPLHALPERRREAVAQRRVAVHRHEVVADVVLVDLHCRAEKGPADTIRHGWRCELEMPGFVDRDGEPFPVRLEDRTERGERRGEALSVRHAADYSANPTIRSNQMNSPGYFDG